MCAFILNGFRLFFIQIDHLKTYSYIFTMLLRCYVCVVLTVYHEVNVCYHDQCLIKKKNFFRINFTI